MALSFVMTFDELRTVAKKRYADMLKRIEYPLPAQREVCIKAQRDVWDHFKNEMGQGGIAWPKSKRAAREGGRTLQDTGRLRASIRYNILSRSEMHVYTYVVYAKYHNDDPAANIKVFGNPKVRYQLPTRKFMWLSPEGNDAIQRTYLRYMMIGAWD